jgi:hypothetical protein
MIKTATATLTGGGTRVATIEELALVPTPERTDTWKPVPHHVVPQVITDMVREREWAFADETSRFQYSLSKDSAKMFGVTKVVIPGVTVDEEFQMAIGFRNSHDKTIALRVAVGAQVTVCDNMMITGDIQVRRIHSNLIDPLGAMREAFERIPGAAQKLTDWFGDLRELKVSEGDGVALLAECVERKALPIFHFMDARASFLKAYAGDNESILHGDTMWGVYQAVTEQFKNHHLDRTQHYSVHLNEVMSERTGQRLQLN